MAVIGSGGSGKSTFAAELGIRLGVDVIHLDRLFWHPGWVPTPRDEWRALQQQLVRVERWVIDGNYDSTLDVRLAAADTIVFFDMPVWVSLSGVLRRWARHHGKPVQAEGCPERVSWSFLRWIWRYRRDNRPRVIAAIRAHAAGAEVIVIRSRRDAERTLAAAPGAGTRTRA